MGTIIIVDDNKGVLTAVQLLLKNHFSKVITLSSPVSLSTVLREENPEVVLLDMNFTSGINNGNEGLFWLHEIKRQYRDLPVVLFSAYADIDLTCTVGMGVSKRTFHMSEQFTLKQGFGDRTHINGYHALGRAW